MAQDASLSVEPSFVSIAPNSKAVARISVRNTGSAVGQYQLRAQGIDSAWIRIEPSQVGVFPGDQATVTIRLNIPQTASAATYTVTIAAVNQIGQPISSQATLTVAIQGSGGDSNSGNQATKLAQPIMNMQPNRTAPAASTKPAIRVLSPGSGQLEIAADRSSASMLPGAQERVNLVVRNNGGAPLAIDVAVNGPPTQWLALTPSFLNLGPAQAASVALTLFPSADAPTGTYPLSVIAQSRDDPTLQVGFDLAFEIAEPGQLNLEVAPPQAEGQISAGFQVKVSQSGMTPLTVNLTASGDQLACNFTFDPANLTVPPRETVVSQLTVAARQALSGADAKTHSFTVTATAAEGTTAMGQAQARFIQRRVPPLELKIIPQRQSSPNEATYGINISNSSQVQAEFRLSASDAQDSCRFRFDPAQLTIPPSGNGKAALVVTPLRLHSANVDQVHTFTVRAVPTDAVLTPLQVDGTFVQTAMEKPVLGLTPSSQSAAGAVAFTLQITNPRAIPMQVEIRPVSADGMCDVAVNPSRFTLPGRGQMTSRVSAKPSSPLLPGESRRSCAFTVQARVSDLDDPVEVGGSLVQVRGAPIGRILALAGAGLLALLLCIGLLSVIPTVLNVLGNSVGKVADVKLPTPLPLVTPLPPPSLTPTPTSTRTSTPMPTQTPMIVAAATLTPKPSATPNAAATAQAAASATAAANSKAQAGATQTASAQQTASANATAIAQQTAQAARYSQYDGNWLNDDANTNGIPQLQVSNNGTTITVHGYGKCSPTNCDWGTRSGTFVNEPFTIMFDFGGGLTHQLTLSKESAKLRVIDVGSSSGTNTYLFHQQFILPPIIIPKITLVHP